MLSSQYIFNLACTAEYSAYLSGGMRRGGLECAEEIK